MKKNRRVLGKFWLLWAYFILLMSHTNVYGGVRVSNSPVCWQSRGWRMISNLEKKGVYVWSLANRHEFDHGNDVWSKKATHLYVELKQLIEWYLQPEKRAGTTLPLRKYLLRWLLSFANKSFRLLFSVWRTFEALVSLCIRKQSLVCFSQLFSVLACTGRLTALQSTGIVVNCKRALY